MADGVPPSTAGLPTEFRGCPAEGEGGFDAIGPLTTVIGFDWEARPAGVGIGPIGVTAAAFDGILLPAGG